MMLQRTPQTLKKSEINKGNAMNFLAFISRIVHVCAVMSRNAIGGKKEEPALIVVRIIYIKTCFLSEET